MVWGYCRVVLQGINLSKIWAFAPLFDANKGKVPALVGDFVGAFGRSLKLDEQVDNGRYQANNAAPSCHSFFQAVLRRLL